MQGAKIIRGGLVRSYQPHATYLITALQRDGLKLWHFLKMETVRPRSLTWACTYFILISKLKIGKQTSTQFDATSGMVGSECAHSHTATLLQPY